LNEIANGAERRLVLRLLKYWRELLDGEQDDRLFPSFADIDPTAIHDIWLHCFALDLNGHESGPVFRAVGRDFNGYHDGELANLPVAELDPESLVGMSSHYFAEVIEKNAPISRGGLIALPDGSQLLYRSILLPMSDDGETISGFLGAANCRREPVDAESDVPADAPREYDYEIV
jgi:hypothetical protein